MNWTDAVIWETARDDTPISGDSVEVAQLNYSHFLYY